MKRIVIFILVVLLISCIDEKKEAFTAQQIVNKAIEVSGGQLHESSKVSFKFRERKYISDIVDGKKMLQRITYTDSLEIKDVKGHNFFRRFFNDSLIQIPDSIAKRYSNSVNSVHYFARLPFGLNDAAVKKELLGEVDIKDKSYYKIKITFKEENGGDDFDDIYIYWFNKETFKPDFLAYEFHVDDGGIRFREVYNERYIGNIRFVDYKNLKPQTKNVSIFKVDSLYQVGELELLSKIELENIEVESMD